MNQRYISLLQQQEGRQRCCIKYVLPYFLFNTIQYVQSECGVGLALVHAAGVEAAVARVGRRQVQVRRQRVVGDLRLDAEKRERLLVSEVALKKESSNLVWNP